MAKSGLDCWRCGAHDMEPPFRCPLGGELENEPENGRFADGMYYSDDFCKLGDGQDVLLRREEWTVDAANTAPHVQHYADVKGYSVTVEWGIVADGNGSFKDIVLCFHSDSGAVDNLGTTFRQCVRRLDELMTVSPVAIEDKRG